jgi:hypothetical protein
MKYSTMPEKAILTDYLHNPTLSTSNHAYKRHSRISNFSNSLSNLATSFLEREREILEREGGGLSVVQSSIR